MTQHRMPSLKDNFNCFIKIARHKIRLPVFLNKFRNIEHELSFKSQKKTNPSKKKQLQTIVCTEGQDWCNIVLQAKPLRQKFIHQWKKHNIGKANSFFEVANQYTSIASREQKARKILDAKLKIYLKQIVNLDYKIQKAKNKKRKRI